jgi:hypothetical protein
MYLLFEYKSLFKLPAEEGTFECILLLYPSFYQMPLESNNENTIDTVFIVNNDTTEVK